MELLLAIVVASAVVLFGALISIGNERQRMAIDGLREQVVLWAMQDLKIKRDRLGCEVFVNDPLEWFSSLASKSFENNLTLSFLEVCDEPKGLVFLAEDINVMILFSLISPKEVSILKSTKHNRLSDRQLQNPLLNLPRGTQTIELSSLNCGVLFDLELSLAWKALTGQHLVERNSIWIHWIA